jgi:hypothetical protein
MTFVHVIDGGAKAQSFEGANAANAKKEFLLDAHVQVTAVELRGDGAVPRTIGGEIGIEEIELNAADSGAPNACSDCAIGKRDVNLHGRHEFDGQDVEVIFFKGFLLPARGVEILAKITHLIEKADTDERKAEVAGGFEMVAGENAESPGKNGKAFGDAKFKREISDEEILVFGVFALIPGTHAGEIGVQAFGDAVEVGEEGIVLGGGFKEGLINAAQHTDRIVSGSFPEVAIEAAEEVDGGVVPAPTEVVGDLQEGLQSVWQGGTNFECGDGLHGVP